MITVNMKAVQKVVDAAQIAFDAYKVATVYALQNHAGYSAALKANAAARAAAGEVLGYMNGLLAQFDADPTKGWAPTDPSWYQKIGKLREGALYQIATVDNAKKLVLADLAAHIKFAFPPAEASQWANADAAAAAAAVDAKQKAAADNPNARKDPSKQDTSAPPVDLPPTEAASSPSWGLWAGLAAGGALLLKILKVW